MSLGIYISVPFCRTKCSFCNFASGVFSPRSFDPYVTQLCSDIVCAQSEATAVGAVLEHEVDSIYLGGGTPSVLAPGHLSQIFQAVRDNFSIGHGAEITVECAPGTISEQILEALLSCGVNRVSLGVQSFVDRECSSVGRLHTRAIVLDDIARLRAAGIGNISVDLIAGLPHQTEESWDRSLAETLAAGLLHVSVYMLEVDEDSRLGNELLAGGSRFHAHFVPDEDLTADLYLAACERLEKGGVQQYEISNFARPVVATPTSAKTALVGDPSANCIGGMCAESRHNLKYWTRQPYIGFGVDAHSMLGTLPELQARGIGAVRFATPDSLEGYLGESGTAGTAVARIQHFRRSLVQVDQQAALEESFFLGLRLNRGISPPELRSCFGDAAIDSYAPVVRELADAGLMELADDRLRLTPRGRLLSNEVFARFLTGKEKQHCGAGK